ncbi:MAG: metallophosphoesterase [Alphaproteobacteria bacterium]|nr:metallophosphoesterase [Alphaproteobacteria bacterium]MCB9929340.1 metallophosphoesterase [Alphaproteobacteria bacterium]
MLRFLHTADWQIGRSFASVPGDAAALLRQARVDAVDRLAEAARNHACPFVLVAGDVFDAEGLAEATLQAPMGRMARARDLVWYLLPGNHDPDRPEGLWDRLARLGLPENVRVLRAAEPVALGDGAVLLPAPLAARDHGDDPTAWMDSAATAEGLVRIGLAHGSIRDFGSGETAVLEREALAPDRAARAGLAYLALGDWHRARSIAANTWYSGTPEPDRFYGPGEPDGGEALVVAVAGPTAPPEVQRVRTARYTWASLDETVADADDIAALAARIDSLTDDPARLVLKLALRGSVPLAVREQAETGLRRRLEGLQVILDWDDDRLLPEPTADDLDAIDRPGGVLRLAAERLQALADDAGNPEAAMARRALARLYLEAKAAHA